MLFISSYVFQSKEKKSVLTHKHSVYKAPFQALRNCISVFNAVRRLHVKKDHRKASSKETSY